jgi:uncharacterized protein
MTTTDTPTPRSIRMRKSVLAAAVATASLAVPAAADAHVTVNPRSVTAGSFDVMSVRVPNERDNKGTVKVDVRFPDGFYFLSYKKVPGWKVKITRETLPAPVDLEGLSITQQISRVVWTGNPKKGGVIRPSQFEEFPVSVRVPDGEAGSQLMFRAIQTYRGGEKVRWTAADPAADTPAPRVTLAAPAALAKRTGGA